MQSMSISDMSFMSPAPTEVDSDNDEGHVQEDDSDIRIIIKKTEKDDNIYQYWAARIRGFPQHFTETRQDCRIQWFLNPDVFEFESTEMQTRYVNKFVKERLERGYSGKFKVGITHKPYNRWTSSRSLGGYCSLGFKEFYIVCIHDDADFIMRLEKAVLEKWRRHTREGHFIIYKDGHEGHPLCLNRNPGGESGSHGVAPFLCYVVFKGCS